MLGHLLWAFVDRVAAAAAGFSLVCMLLLVGQVGGALRWWQQPDLVLSLIGLLVAGTALIITSSKGDVRQVGADVRQVGADPRALGREVREMRQEMREGYQQMTQVLREIRDRL